MALTERDVNQVNKIIYRYKVGPIEKHNLRSGEDLILIAEIEYLRSLINFSELSDMVSIPNVIP